MPCHCECDINERRKRADACELPVLTVDVRDAVGDRLHISEEFKKDGVRYIFTSSSGQHTDPVDLDDFRAWASTPDQVSSHTIHRIGSFIDIEDHRNIVIGASNDKSASRALKDSRGRKAFAKTRHPVENGPACRIYGTMEAKKVTGNLHVVRENLLSY